MTERHPLDSLADAHDERERVHLADPTNAPPMFCEECDFDLRGTPDGRCPECGAHFSRIHASTFSTTSKAAARKQRVKGTAWLIGVVAFGFLCAWVMRLLEIPEEVVSTLRVISFVFMIGWLLWQMVVLLRDR